jgi:PRC-barrel domain protein
MIADEHAKCEIEGATVLGPTGERIGTIQRLITEQASGRILYADLAFGGFFGFRVQHCMIPWESLTYDPHLRAYRVDATEAERIARSGWPRVSPARMLHGRW